MKTSCIPLALAATVTLALAQSAVQTAGDYVYQGCYNDVLDANTGRTLGEAAYDDHSNMTVESCASFCADAGYAWMGVEYGSEWYGSKCLLRDALIYL